MNWMDWLVVAGIGVSLSMDAAAVSMCKGLAVGKVRPKHCLLAGGYFGVFQGLMPMLGYVLVQLLMLLLGSMDIPLETYVTRYAGWISFALLAFIGFNMIRESFGEEEECQSCSFSPAAMLPLAVATSIDAMVTGVTFGLEEMTLPETLIAALLITAITFAVASIAVWLGGLVGDKYGTVAERIGGIVLILLGIKFLLSGLGVL